MNATTKADIITATTAPASCMSPYSTAYDRVPTAASTTAMNSQYNAHLRRLHGLKSDRACVSPGVSAGGRR